MGGVIYIQKMALNNSKIAVEQWKKYGNSMKNRAGWSDSHLRTNVGGSDLHEKKTIAWSRPGQARTPVPVTAKTPTPGTAK